MTAGPDAAVHASHLSHAALEITFQALDAHPEIRHALRLGRTHRRCSYVRRSAIQTLFALIVVLFISLLP